VLHPYDNVIVSKTKMSPLHSVGKGRIDS